MKKPGCASYYLLFIHLASELHRAPMDARKNPHPLARKEGLVTGVLGDELLVDDWLLPVLYRVSQRACRPQRKVEIALQQTSWRETAATQ